MKGLEQRQVLPEIKDATKSYRSVISDALHELVEACSWAWNVHIAFDSPYRG